MGARMKGVFQAQFLDLAGDGVATNAQLLSGFNPAPTGVAQGGLNQFGLKTTRQHVPHIGLASQQQSQRLGFQAVFPAADQAWRLWAGHHRQSMQRVAHSVGCDGGFNRP